VFIAVWRAGGSKGNNVVEALWTRLRRHGDSLTVCRYNSSGVGTSEGACLADVESEAKDLAAVCRYLRQARGCAALVLVGYRCSPPLWLPLAPSAPLPVSGAASRQLVVPHRWGTRLGVWCKWSCLSTAGGTHRWGTRLGVW
jgi:hypothetical protein